MNTVQRNYTKLQPGGREIQGVNWAGRVAQEEDGGAGGELLSSSCERPVL